LDDENPLTRSLKSAVGFNRMVLHKDYATVERQEAEPLVERKTKKAQERAAAEFHAKNKEKMDGVIDSISVGFLALRSTRSALIAAVDAAIEEELSKPAAQLSTYAVIELKNIRFRTAGPVMDPDTFEPVLQFVIRVDLEFKLVAQ